MRTIHESEEVHPQHRRHEVADTHDPSIRVPVTAISLAPAPDGTPHEDVHVYRTRGPGSDPQVGLPEHRAAWIADRGDVETYAGRPRDLAEAHRRAGLKVLRCGYEQTANWRVVVVDPELRPAYRRALRHGLAGASKLVWALERRGLRVRPNRLSSPYVACLARLDTVHQ